jgi:isocitrate dehydrogenase kinase/phosphatase
VVFLPEELQHGMQLMNRYARRCFREENLDLLSVDYWQDVQQKLLRGEVPPLQMFPDSCKLDVDPGDAPVSGALRGGRLEEASAAARG